jgi:hypothetical protein
MLEFQFDDKHIPLYMNRVVVPELESKLIKTVCYSSIIARCSRDTEEWEIANLWNWSHTHEPCPFNHLIQNTERGGVQRRPRDHETSPWQQNYTLKRAYKISPRFGALE